MVDQAQIFDLTKGLRVRGSDNWHPNSHGYFIIARLIYNKMIDREIIKAETLDFDSEVNSLKDYINSRKKHYEYLTDNKAGFNEGKFMPSLHDAGLVY